MAAFEEFCVRIHSNKLSSSDSETDEKGDYDEKYFSAKPPPIPYEQFQHNIVRLDSSEATEDASFVLPKNRRRNRRRRTQNALGECEEKRLVHKSSDVNWRQVQNETKLSSSSCKLEGGTHTKWPNAYIDKSRSFAEVVKTVNQSAVAQKSQETINSEKTISDDVKSQVPHKKKKKRRKRKKRNKRKSMKVEEDVGNQIFEKRSGENVETSGDENSFSSHNDSLLDRAILDHDENGVEPATNDKTSLFYENHSDSEDEWFAEETHKSRPDSRLRITPHKSDGWIKSAMNDETSHEKLFHENSFTGQNKRLLEKETSYHDENCRICRFGHGLEYLGIKSSVDMETVDEKLFQLANRNGQLLVKADRVRDKNGADTDFGGDESEHLRLRPHKSDRCIKSSVNVETSDEKHFREDSLTGQNLDDRHCRIAKRFGVMQKGIKSREEVLETTTQNRDGKCGSTKSEHLVLVPNQSDRGNDSAMNLKTSGEKNYFTSQNGEVLEKDVLDRDRNGADFLALVPYKSDRGIDSPMDVKTFPFTRLMSVYLQFILETIQNVINS